MQQEFCEIVLLRREDSWNITFLTMKWKPFFRKLSVFPAYKKERHDLWSFEEGPVSVQGLH